MSEQTRRGFMKNTTVAASAAAVAGAIGARAHAANNETLKIALVGCGGRGTGATLQALSTDGPVQLAAMADAFGDNLENKLKHISRSKPKQVAIKAGDKYVGFDAYKKVMARDDIDLVILTTPPGFRPMHFEAAVKAGKHVFMEKPVASDPHGVRRVLAAAQEAKKKKLKVGVGLQRHHSSNYQEIIKRIHDGQIGEIVSMRCYWNGTTPWVRSRQPGQSEMEYQMRNWYFFNWLCGDHIVEQHIHNLDVCNWVMGDYPSVAQGMGGREVRTGKDHGEIFDHHAVEYVYGNNWDRGVHMYSYCRHIRGCWNSVSEHVYGTKGYATVSGARLYDRKGNQIWKPARGRKVNPYQQEHNALFAAIRNDTPHNEAENGAKSTMTAIFGRMATYSGKMLTWKRALETKVDVFPHDPNYNWDWKGKAPVMPDANGRYITPKPGKSKVV